MARLIGEYLDILTRELSFDPLLARRLRAEVEDHLRESVASDPMGATAEAECRAIDRFGTARDFATHWAVPSLARQTKLTGAAAASIVIAVLIAMKSRVAWYGESAVAIHDDAQLAALRTIIFSIDRYAFWLALFGAVGAAVLIGFERATGAPNTAWRKRLRRSLFLCSVASAAISVTVMSDIALTVLRLFPEGWAAASLFPSLTISIETALAVFLVVRTVLTIQRLASTASLFMS